MFKNMPIVLGVVGFVVLLLFGLGVYIKYQQSSILELEKTLKVKNQEMQILQQNMVAKEKELEAVKKQALLALEYQKKLKDIKGGKDELGKKEFDELTSMLNDLTK